jgi:hypothetical protein
MDQIVKRLLNGHLVGTAAALLAIVFLVAIIWM